MAKAVLGLTITAGLIERLTIDRALRRICGFPLSRKLPSEATFSRAFEEFAERGLAERVHEALVKEHLGNELIEHISRDGTAIEAREHPAPAKEPPIHQQKRQTLAQMLEDIPAACPSRLCCPLPRCTTVVPPFPCR